MLCVIPGSNLKVFARAIHSLSKIGEEIYFEASLEGLAIRTVNSSRSAFATFTFKPSFFLKFKHSPNNTATEKAPNNTATENDTNNNTANNNDDNDGGGDNEGEGDNEDEGDKEGVGDKEGGGDNDESMKCKVYTKSCLTVFKSLSSIDKTVDRCKIFLNLHDDRFIFQLFCRYGLVKTFKLTFIECERLKAVFDTHSSPNCITCQSKLLSEVVANFQQGEDELSVTMTTDCVHFKNHVDQNQETSGSCVQSKVLLHADEFEQYEFGEETVSVFCLKEFRAFLFFCEVGNMQVCLHADHAGKPIIFSLTSDPSFQCQLVLATVSSDHLKSTPGAPKGRNKEASKNKETAKNKEATKNKEAAKNKERKNRNCDDKESESSIKRGGGGYNGLNEETVDGDESEGGGAGNDDYHVGENDVGKGQEKGYEDGDNDDEDDDVMQDITKGFENGEGRQGRKNVRCTPMGVVGEGGDEDLLMEMECGDDLMRGSDDNDVVEASPPRPPPNKKFKSLFSSLTVPTTSVLMAEDSE